MDYESRADGNDVSGPLWIGLMGDPRSMNGYQGDGIAMFFSRFLRFSVCICPLFSGCLMSTDPTTNLTPSAASTSVEEPVEDLRNPILWPFSSTSIWNQPIGDSAEYVPANLEPAKLTADTDHFFVLRPDDTQQDLFRIGGWRNRSSGTRDRGIDLPLPDALIIPDTNEQETPNNSVAFLMPDGDTLIQLNATARPEIGGSIYGVKYPFPPYEDETLTGEGSLGGHGGSGLSSIGGTLRIGELVGDDPIRHVLKMNVWAQKYLSYTQGFNGGLGYRWPAIKADSYADATEYGGTVPELVMGSLLALPPDVTPESLGLQTKPAQKLFEAFQNYGAYIADDTAREVYALEVESGALQEFEYAYGYSFRDEDSPFHDDMMAIFSALSVVNNNGPGAIGGGGTPRVDLAPPIDPDAVPELQALLADPTVEDTFEADFNGDGTLDILWRNLAVGSMQAWLRDETGEIVGGGNILPLASWNWQIVGTQDVNGDGRADLQWRDRVTGAEQIWYLDDVRLWIDPTTGKRVARWIESASGAPRIETFGSSLMPDETHQYEAESLTTDGYEVVENGLTGASNDQFVSLSALNPTGTISGVFDGSAGLYQVEVLVFDENDGESSLTVTVGDTATTLILDEDLGDSALSPLSLTQRITHDAIALQTGDTFTIEAIAAGEEFARIDAIRFTPLDNSNTATSIDSIIAPPETLPEPPVPVDSAPETLDPLTDTASSFISSVVDLTNALRVDEGLDPVTFNVTLAEAAQQHTNDMAQYGFFSHLGLNDSTPLARVEAIVPPTESQDDVPPPSEEEPIWAIAENIGLGYKTPGAIVDAWQNSPSHRAHLLNPNYTYIGIGYTSVNDDEASETHYWTQLLGTEVEA